MVHVVDLKVPKSLQGLKFLEEFRFLSTSLWLFMCLREFQMGGWWVLRRLAVLEDGFLLLFYFYYESLIALQGIE